MGKFRIGNPSPSGISVSRTQKVGPAPLKTESVIQGLTEAQVLELLTKHMPIPEPKSDIQANLLPSFATLPYLEPKTETVIKHTEIVKEVSKLDKRARQHTKALKGRLDALSHKVAVEAEATSGHNIDIEALQQHCAKLESKLYELEQRETVLEAQIPEQPQEVKAVAPGLIYLGLSASILLSVLSLILR